MKFNKDITEVVRKEDIDILENIFLIYSNKLEKEINVKLQE